MSTLNSMFDNIDPATLEALGLTPADDLTGFADNVCELCQANMYERDDKYVCENCSNCKDVPTSEQRSTASRTVVVRSGASRRIYNIPTDPQETKRRIVLEELRLRNRSTPPALHIPDDILVSTAGIYSDVQKNKLDAVIDSETNELLGEAAWVHRGTIKEEILSSLIYFIAQTSGVAKKKRDIAKFMGLQADGFSRGEDIVRELASSKHIFLEIDIETPRIFAERYLEALGLEQPWHSDFVVEVVEHATSNNWCLNCQLSSKVAGAICMLVRGVSLDRLAGKNITDGMLEKNTDGTKKNTFRKIIDVVVLNPDRFQHIFLKYQVALPKPIRTRARKK